MPGPGHTKGHPNFNTSKDPQKNGGAFGYLGRGEDYYLPGFWVNIAWGSGLLISLLIGWPVLGFVLGGLRGDLLAWRRDRRLRRVAAGVTLLWLLMFAARLAVQVPLYSAAKAGGAAGQSATDALGVARLVMGVPLFALVVACTWMVLSRLRNVSSLPDAVEGEPRGNESETEDTC